MICQPVTVLFITVRADFGGGPEHLWQLLQKIPAGFRPYVACPEDYPYYERYRKIVGSDHIIKLPHRHFSIGKFWTLLCFCKDHHIDLLHSHGKGAGLYSRFLAILTGLPCVHTFHGVHMGEYSPIKRWIYRLYERSMSFFTQVGVAVSEGERTQIIAEQLMPASKIRLIPNGVSITDDMAFDAYSLSHPYVVVTLTRFDHQKNSNFILDIVEVLDANDRLGDFQFVLVGDGKYRQSILKAAQVNRWNHAISCPGVSTRPHSFFIDSLCYLSTSRWEGMPLAVLEAMAHGLPVVASDVVGNRDVVCHGCNGFLYPEGDAEEAATALCKFADNLTLRQTMGGKAREYVLRNHYIDEMVASTFGVLNQVSRLT